MKLFINIFRIYDIRNLKIPDEEKVIIISIFLYIIFKLLKFLYSLSYKHISVTKF